MTAGYKGILFSRSCCKYCYNAAIAEGLQMHPL